MKCVIVGAGPVGALAALYAANRGWDVEIYELRGDLRDASTTPLNFTKSINLALSERGINALRHSGSSGLLDSVLEGTIPMYGRMIHGQDRNGDFSEASQKYDVHGRYQRAVDRGQLNRILLDGLADSPSVKLFFHHKLTGADFRKRKAWLEHRSPSNERLGEIEVDFDLMLGCDGAHSRVRYHMAKFIRLSYEQSYIDTLWCEFTIPPTSSTDAVSTTTSAKDGFATSPNHLHIWPSDDEMFIAIPSIDKTFTCTLFAKEATFASLEQAPEQVEPFFRNHFPGAADLVGPSKLRQLFENNPHLPLISIKCSPHHVYSSGVILGDAAHAMVPFYGQGMNAGLEDVRILFDHFDRLHPSTTPDDVAAALDAYTRERVPDAHTINDLAFANYWEMHAGVQSPTYLLRKHLEEFLSDRVPSSGFATQYSRVSFSNQRYSEVASAVARQKRMLIAGLTGSAIVPLIGVVAWWCSSYFRKSNGGATQSAARSGSLITFAFNQINGIVKGLLGH